MQNLTSEQQSTLEDLTKMMGFESSEQTLDAAIAALRAHYAQARQGDDIAEAIREGYQDIEAGRYFKSSGDVSTDMRMLVEKEQQSWM